MQPGTVRAKKQFSRTCHLDCLNEVIELTHARGVSKYICITGQLIDNLLVRLPVVGKAAKVCNYEIHVRVLRCKHVDYFGPADHVHEYGKTKSSGGITNFASRHAIETMDLDSAEVPTCYRLLDHCKNMPCIALAMKEGKSNQTAAMRSD